ncbi:hypothetical protein KCP77_11935 [Salmonella enterica subsp. enterica]|nr:hypothetical protein KCP77_11935 [Salmonella enterica subsp. enterica]
MLAHSRTRSCKRKSVNAGITVYSRNSKELAWYGHPVQGRYQPYIATDPAVLAYSSELSRHQRSAASKVTFENAPQGMRVTDIPKSGNPLMNINP